MKIPTVAALYYARRANDESNDVLTRMVAYATLGVMSQEELFIEVPDLKPLHEPEKPKYIWRNGARVKVK